jgi:hypothetical protein
LLHRTQRTGTRQRRLPRVQFADEPRDPLVSGVRRQNNWLRKLPGADQQFDRAVGEADTLKHLASADEAI